jgi:hypothetical protein
MSMTRLFQSVMLVCMLSLAPSATYGVEGTSEAYEAFAAAAAQPQPTPQPTPQQVAAIAGVV